MLLQVVSREQQAQYSAMLLPFDVIPELETPAVVTQEDPEVAKAFHKLQVISLIHVPAL